jgi:hypothetical protein
VLFLLISRKFNTLCFLAIVATLELSAMGAGLLPHKEPPFLFPTGARIPEVLLKIESIGQ